MKRAATVVVFALAGLLGRPATASADVTFFLGFSPTPETRSTRGFSAGINMLLIGFEFDYAHTSADEAQLAPSLRTGLMNVVLMTPTRTQLYLTAGAGVYRETLLGVRETNGATSFGGGVKISLVGPVQVRLDYRRFNLAGNALYKHPHRFYAGLNIAF